MRKLIAVAAAVLALTAVAVPAPASANVIASGPGAWVTTFATQVVVVSRSAPTMYVNADAFAHNVLSDATRPDEPGCYRNKTGCALFYSALIGAGATPVIGIEDAQVGQVYGFFCQPHPWMKGQIVVVE